MEFEEILKAIWMIAFMILLGIFSILVTWLSLWHKEEIRELRGELWKRKRN